ncbi:MAG: 4Fe-4S binding protein [Methanomassiliicoccaceae archaeon]|nr:4Fe-4S binding protein [Methanomassiliicoccaceae archaeon]
MSLVPGGRVIEPGSALKFLTGDWRSFRPVYDDKKCSHCMLCWMYCPDETILVKDGKMNGIMMTHCKGCGLCAKHCPKKAITMIQE